MSSFLHSQWSIGLARWRLVKGYHFIFIFLPFCRSPMPQLQLPMVLTAFRTMWLCSATVIVISEIHVEVSEPLSHYRKVFVRLWARHLAVPKVLKRVCGPWLTLIVPNGLLTEPKPELSGIAFSICFQLRLSCEPQVYQPLYISWHGIRMNWDELGWIMIESSILFGAL
jgi:hypothetical protein